MTTPAKVSSAAYVLQRLRFRACLVAAGLLLAVPLFGCGLFHSDFDIAVGNRTANPVSFFADGGKLGDVGSNQTATFTVEETPIGHTAVDSTGTSTSPSATAQVTLSAQDMTTGMLSAGLAATLVKHTTTYVDVTPCVAASLIEPGSAPPCLSVPNASVSSSGTTGSPGQACTFSLSASAQSFEAPGGTGNVTVTTSTGCTWNATSSESWLTVVSGSSGTGAGVVMFRVAANTSGLARAASLTIGGQTFTVNQTA
jgi:hypothetical protein